MCVRKAIVDIIPNIGKTIKAGDKFSIEQIEGDLAHCVNNHTERSGLRSLCSTASILLGSYKY